MIAGIGAPRAPGIDRLFSYALGLALVIGPRCAHAPDGSAPANLVFGTVSYRERITLPQDAVVEIRLEDVSAQDVAATTVAETTVLPAGRQAPIPFELRYDPAAILANRTYAVRASIRSGSTLLFTTTTSHRVVPGAQQSGVEIVLERVGAPADGEPAAGGSILLYSKWRLTQLGTTPVIEGIVPTLEFPEPGKVSGSGSCNRFFGTVEFDGERIHFHPLGTTRRACREDMMSQEERFMKAIQEADRFVLQEPELILYSRAIPDPLRFFRVP